MASASYEAVAATRPRIRRDVLFTETPDGVLFHNADGGFRLNAKSAYRFATLLVPHLTGENSVAELCNGLGEAQRAMVGELVRTLYERDFARDVPAPGPQAAEAALPEDVARRFAPQIAYIDHYADRPEERFARFRGTRVAVLGTDPIADWAVRGLIRNGCGTVGVSPGHDSGAWREDAAEAAADGCPVEVLPLPEDALAPAGSRLDGWDVVLATGPGAPALVTALLAAGLPEGQRLVAAWPFGDDLVVGPLMARGSRGCWSCAALRLGSNGDRGAAADLWSSLALPGSAPGGATPGRPLAAMTGNLLGYEVFRLTSGALPQETEGQIVVQDMESLDVSTEVLLPHPRCPRCAEQPQPAEADLGTAAVAEGASAPATAAEVEAAVEELNSRSLLVRPRAGVFRRFADEPLTQIPLKISAVELGLGHAPARTVTAFDVHHVAGARLRALDAAARVYAEHVVPARGLVEETEARPGTAAPARIGADALVLASGLPAEGTPPCLPALSLLTKETVLVPAGAVRPFGPHNTDRCFERSSAGTGAGPSAADAAARGLLSALAHDALLRAVRGEAAAAVPLPAATAEDEAPGTDAELLFLVRSADRLGVPVELLDLGEQSRTGVSVLLARHGAHWAVGSETSRRGAAVAALRDLLGAVQYEREETGRPTDTGDPLLRDLDARALTVTGTADPAAAPASVPWSDVLDRLRAAGRDAFLVPTGAADLAAAGIHTARVLLTKEDPR
ncbi:TOMM precursor leader peptide-binding protein [Streptomyces sp. NA04227]|uniref:TOMM precursor leader peptide-binding protein n=1 Tax=Streptomyces sp. NA04227 TaxID=2742136 RepID=UPI0015916B0A|nr:TOMM precursor leader peptide-binding protein [Streptomyces sp. NA04227]QKW05499.1 TOMM precursor leader peptide-binding protein [Streptomyces sp. NA04227]